MKKILTIMALLVAFVTTGFAENKTVYLNTGGSELWNQGGAHFVVWAWVTGSEGDWYEMTAIESGSDIFSAEVPDVVDHLHFVRFKDTTTSWGWDENLRWNQTGDISIGDGQNMWTITGWNETDYSAGTYTPAVEYTATFDNGGDWVNVYAYAWSGEGDGATLFLGDWPGTALVKNGDVYTVSFESNIAPEKIIFNNGNHGQQTANLDFVNGQAYTYSINLPGTPIWSGDAFAFDWNNGNYKVLDASLFSNAKVGDILHIAVGGVTPSDDAYSAQVGLQDALQWKNLESAVPVGTGAVSDASIVLTGDILTKLKDHGVVVTGFNYSSRLITLEEGTVTGSDNSIWIGSASSWFSIGQSHIANANNFEGVKAGDVIRVTLDKASWVQLRYSDKDYQWIDPEASEINDWDGKPVDFILTEAVATAINTSTNTGIIINHGETVTQVEIIPSGYYVVKADNDWSTVSSMTESEGVYSAVLENVAGKMFVIAPNYALTSNNDGILRWYHTIRPASESGDWEVKYFKNYDANTKTNSGADVWHVSNDNTSTLTLTYKPTASKFAITTDATETVTITSAGYATYSNRNGIKITGAEEVSIVKSLTGNTIDLTPVTGNIPDQTGVIVKGTTSFTVSPADAGEDVEYADVTGNMLIGTDYDGGYDITGIYPESMGGGNYTAYILANKEPNGVGFYLFDNSAGNNVAAKKAFLAIPEGYGQAPFLGFGGEGTTGIVNVNRETITNNQYYTLDGCRVENPTKGLYIINGKKVVIK